MIHNLKCDPRPFAAVLAGLKNYEIRVNDRGYQVGHTLRLQETSADRKRLTGRVITKRVIYMTAGGSYGLPSSLCVLGMADA